MICLASFTHAQIFSRDDFNRAKNESVGKDDQGNSWGEVINISIFDINGGLIKNLVENQIAAKSGFSSIFDINLSIVKGLYLLVYTSEINGQKEVVTWKILRITLKR